MFKKSLSFKENLKKKMIFKILSNLPFKLVFFQIVSFYYFDIFLSILEPIRLKIKRCFIF
ncbi:hypothetical protein EJ772_09150 [Campylobacter upsaliensis]|nr:hypothetical protein [Campylobacter upsaliensis]